MSPTRNEFFFCFISVLLQLRATVSRTARFLRSLDRILGWTSSDFEVVRLSVGDDARRQDTTQTCFSQCSLVPYSSVHRQPEAIFHLECDHTARGSWGFYCGVLSADHPAHSILNLVHVPWLSLLNVVWQALFVLQLSVPILDVFALFMFLCFVHFSVVGIFFVFIFHCGLRALCVIA